MTISNTKQPIKKAVLTDAGYATRFLPVTKTLPKSMLPIMDKPIMQYVIEEVMVAGITEIIIVSTEEGKPIYEDYFHNTVQHIYNKLNAQGKADRFQKVREVFSLPNVIVITQNKSLPYGTASPALSAKPYLGNEPFIYAFTDDLILGKSSCLELVEKYQQTEDDVVAVLATKFLPDADVTKYGVYTPRKDNPEYLEKSVEKPNPDEVESRLVNFGRYLFTSKIFDYIEPTKSNLGKDSELWINDGICRMAQQNKVLLKPIQGEWLTTGDPINYLKASLKVAYGSSKYKEIVDEMILELK